MFRAPLNFEIVQGETEHIEIGGRRRRNPTVLIRVGRMSLSKKALILGAALVGCQIADGTLTYLGLTLFGVHMEGNVFLRHFMEQYGMGWALFVAKALAVCLAVALMFNAHRRRWVRPLILFAILVYFGLAVLPWIYKISAHKALVAG